MAPVPVTSPGPFSGAQQLDSGAPLPLVPSSPDPRGSFAPILGLFFLSGFAGLTYEVLWQRELGLLFGNTTQATATTLAVFFLGLAGGGWWIGRRSSTMPRPLLAFARLELGVALSGLLLPLLLPLYRSLFAPLQNQLGVYPALFAAVKFSLAAMVLGPPAFLMGGTLPVLAELAARGGRGFARAGAWLYGINTAGAVVGAFLAGFVLPRSLGYRGAYGVAIGTSLLVGLLAWLGARWGAPQPTRDLPSPERVPGSAGRSIVSRDVLALAALSGFLSLGLEVLWTRLYALVFVNSVYSFAAVLVTFLVALVLGTALAGFVGRRTRRPGLVLWGALSAAGAGVLLSALLCRSGVDTSVDFGPGATWGAYVLRTFGLLALYMLPPAVLVGFVFPFLMRVEEERGGPLLVGTRMGALLAANTIGALLGALVGGFVLPTLLGTWLALAVLALLFPLAGLLLEPRLGARRRWLRLACLLPMIGFALGQGRADDAWLTRPGETLLAVYEGSSGVVSVVEREGTRRLRFNDSYTLGGTGEPRWEHYQAHIPLCLHPEPRRVCILGLGTGITAGAVLEHDVELVRIAEIVPQAVQAAREYFAPWLNGLFEDPRVQIVVEDGRTVLLGIEETYDVVLGDLFLPWKRGTALLYTVEQFESVRRRLAPGGIFAQWLPLYQMSEQEFLGIARSFAQVFPHARVWRGDFFSRRPIVALVGTHGEAPLDGASLAAAWLRLQERGAVSFGPAIASLPFLLQVGPLSAIADQLQAGRIITDDRPWLQFEAPVSQRARIAGLAQPFVGARLAALQRAFRNSLPVASDPYLSQLTEDQRRCVEGGLSLYEFAVHRNAREVDAATRALAAFMRAVPESLRPALLDWVR